MSYIIKLMIIKLETVSSIAIIKELGSLSGLGPYESKCAYEEGLLFDSAVEMSRFMAAIQLRFGNLRFEIENWPGGPQDVRNLRF